MSPRLTVVVAALLLSATGTAIKFTALPAFVLVAGRSAVAALVLATFLRWRRQPVALNPARIVGAVAFALTLIGFVLGHRLTAAISAIFLVSLAPLFATIGARLVLGEPIARRTVGSLALLVVGAVIIVFGRTGGGFAVGEWCAIGAAFCWGATLVALRSAPDADNLWTFAFGNAIAVVLASALFAVSTGPGTPLPGSLLDIGIVVAMGAVQLGAAFVLIERAARRLPAADVAMLMLIEPILSPGIVYLVVGETPTPLQVFGAVVMTTALILQQWSALSRSERLH